MMKWSDILRN